MKSSKTVDEIVKNMILTELSILTKNINFDENINFDKNVNFDKNASRQSQQPENVNFEPIMRGLKSDFCY